MKRTKIICTMGPNTNDRNLMKALAENGMDVARFNFSHGDYEEQKMRLDMLKSVREELDLPIAALLDTKGPEIRTGVLKDGKKVTLVEARRIRSQLMTSSATRRWATSPMNVSTRM